MAQFTVFFPQARRGSIPFAYTRAKETRANELMKVLTLISFLFFPSPSITEKLKMLKDQVELFVLQGKIFREEVEEVRPKY